MKYLQGMESFSSGQPSFLDVRCSLKGHRWVFPPVEEEIVTQISRMHGLPDYIARMLHLRGVGPEDVESFLYPTLRNHFPDPFVMAGMPSFAEDFARRVVDRQCIGVLADFDVDGATSAAILIRFFRHLGLEPPVYIPDRLSQGYGPNIQALHSLHTAGAKAVIMSDCGITAFDPVESGRNMGMDIVIFDHHEPEESLPNANHIINPKRKDDTSGFSMLAACGVSFMACVAINSILKQHRFYERSGLTEPPLKTWLDLVALGTVCDMVPMSGPNRLFVRHGFEQMAQKKNAGLRALCEVSKLEIPPEPVHAGFVFGPRINAGSRVHRSDLGARLLSTDDMDEARSIAFVLDDCNEQRKAIQSEMMKEAINRVESEGLDQRPIIVVDDSRWHPGLSGLVAGRLKERFGKPAIVVTYAEGGDGVLEGRGSGRSVVGVNMAQTFISARAAGLLVKGGGHAMAAGFTIMPDRLSDFRDFLYEEVARQKGQTDLGQETMIDGIASIRGAQPSFVKLLTERVGPFGPSNTEPVFALPHLRILSADVLKDRHIRVQVSDWEGGGRMKAMFFHGVGTSLGEALLNHQSRFIHLVGQFQINTWQGRENVEFFVSDGAFVSENHKKAA